MSTLLPGAGDELDQKFVPIFPADGAHSLWFQ